jgi:hypothetical protein
MVVEHEAGIMSHFASITNVLLTISIILTSASLLQAQDTTSFPEIPRIDVHTHVANDLSAISNYHKLREILKQNHGIEMAMWINLGDRNKPINSYDEVISAGMGRILCCISDYSAHDGLKYTPNELPKWLERGYIGYKIWAGPPHRRLKPGQKGYPYIDDPAHEPTFAKMEKIGMVCASIHIADPHGPWGNRTKWLPDSVEYWKEITAWRHVLEKHHDLVVVSAHGMWSLCQDGQIDYLRNMLATFPKLNIDLAATFQYFPFVTRENLRSFMIEYADQILFGTDVGRWIDPTETAQYARRYFRCFQILETDKITKGGFFSQNEIKGLALPKDVLEKIYYKNAMRIYPGLKQSLQQLGYSVE